MQEVCAFWQCENKIAKRMKYMKNPALNLFLRFFQGKKENCCLCDILSHFFLSLVFSVAIMHYLQLHVQPHVSNYKKQLFFVKIICSFSLNYNLFATRLLFWEHLFSTKVKCDRPVINDI